MFRPLIFALLIGSSNGLIGELVVLKMPGQNPVNQSCMTIGQVPRTTKQEDARTTRIQKNVGLFFFYSDSGFYVLRPVRLDRSAKASLH